MKISALIEELEKAKNKYGDIEVTCTAALVPDQNGQPLPDVFESTVEHVTFVQRSKGKPFGNRVRICL